MKTLQIMHIWASHFKQPEKRIGIPRHPTQVDHQTEEEQVECRIHRSVNIKKKT